MKRLMVVAALALSGCVAGQEDAPVQFSSALALSGAPGSATACTVDTSKAISRGRLNIAEGGNYTLAMAVRSVVTTGRISTVGGTNVSSGGESATLTEYAYTYESSIPLGLPTEESVATYSVLAAGASNSYVFVNAFGPKAFAKLIEAADAGKLSGSAVSVISTIKARGRLGASSHIESNEFPFPVSIVNGTCPADTNPSSICNPGQDFYCAPKTTTTP